MKEKIVTIKVFESTRKALNIIAAKGEETHPQIVERLVKPELIKVEKKKN